MSLQLYFFIIFSFFSCFFFFFNDTATTEIYTLSLHDALPIRRGCDGPAPAACEIGDRIRNMLRRGTVEREDEVRVRRHAIGSVRRIRGHDPRLRQGRAGGKKKRRGDSEGSETSELRTQEGEPFAGRGSGDC